VSEPGNPVFPEEDLAVLEILASRAGIAFENARLYEREHEIATELQSAMLPAELPRPLGLRFVARYLTAAAGLRIGGDWYDAFSLGDGRLVCCVGDVVGTGIRAASAMGQLRSAVRALAATSAGPAEVLERLDSFATSVEGGRMTTLAYVEIDPQRNLLRYACAGHPPPLLLHDGKVRLLEAGRSAPLACFRTSKRAEAVEQLPTTASLILYSDGLVERRGEPFDAGLERLSNTVMALARMDEGIVEHIDELVERMLEGLVQRDDVCVLVASGVERRTFHYDLRADPNELRPLRQALREWLSENGLAGDESNRVLLATGEACANAIEHGQRFDGRAGVSVDLDLEADGELTAVVSDKGSWRPPTGGNRRGRGLPLIRFSMESFELDRSDSGTTVRMRRKLAMRGDA
jgi:serine/threonine-protein kinase RsbW